MSPHTLYPGQFRRKIMSYKLELGRLYNIIDDAKSRKYAFLGVFYASRDQPLVISDPQCLCFSIYPFLDSSLTLGLSPLPPMVRILLAKTHIYEPFPYINALFLDWSQEWRHQENSTGEEKKTKKFREGAWICQEKQLVKYCKPIILLLQQLLEVWENRLEVYKAIYSSLERFWED